MKADAAMEQITKALTDASGRRQEVKELSVEVAEKDSRARERQEHIKQEASFHLCALRSRPSHFEHNPDMAPSPPIFFSSVQS